MKILLIALVLPVLAFAEATPKKKRIHDRVDCTSEPKEKWLDKDEFKKKLEQEYNVKRFIVTPPPGNCYEIYGTDKNGKRIEIYFHPVTGALVRNRDLGE